MTTPPDPRPDPPLPRGPFLADPTLAPLGHASAPWHESLRQDLAFAGRSLFRNKAFAVVAALTAAVAIGGATVAMSIADGLVLKSPPIPEPERMVSIWELRSVDVAESMEGRLIDYARYEAYRDATEDVFEGLAGHSYAHFSLGTDEGAAAVDGFLTSGNYFAVLGVTPAAGRLYADDDEATAVISERLWQSRFGGDPSVVGSQILVNSRTFTLGGVARAGFVGTMSTFTGDLWLPAPAYSAQVPGGDAFDDLPTVGARAGLVVPTGRLREGLTVEQATERVNQVAPLVRAQEDADLRVRGARLDDIRWRADLRSFLDVGLGALLGAAAMLLLIACANIAGLFLARAYDRHREVAVRMAIGSGRWRIVRQMVTENLVLFLVGGAGGALLAWALSRAVASVDVPLNATITLDTTAGARTLTAGIGLSLFLGAVFGLLPARQASRLDLSTSLKEGAQRSSGGRVRSAFVVGQVAVATLLLVMAGLTTRSFLKILDVDLGFEAEGMLVATFDVASHGYDEARGRAFYDELLTRVRALPGVESASLAEFGALRGASASNGMRAADGGEDAPSVSVSRNVVDPAFAEVNRLELVQGRFIGEEDQAGDPWVAVLNETAAERLWPGRNPLGRTVRTGGREHEVIGVVRDGVYAFTFEEPKAYAWYADTQRYRPGRTVHVRAQDLSALPGQIREIVHSLDPAVALQSPVPMTQVVSANQFMPRFLWTLTAAFAVTGLLLACLGVYGMLSVHVARRKREFGVRMALGARAVQILTLVMSRGARLAAVGCFLGLAGAFATARLLSALLYGIQPFDWVTFVTVPVLLLATSVLASLWPARRATSVDPRTALQEV